MSKRGFMALLVLVLVSVPAFFVVRWVARKGSGSGGRAPLRPDCSIPVYGVQLWRELELADGGVSPFDCHWYELCRGLGEAKASQWSRLLKDNSLRHVSKDSSIIVWMRHFNEACQVLGPDALAQWVLLVRGDRDEPLEEFGQALTGVHIDWRLIDGDLCVRLRERVRASHLLGLLPYRDAYVDVIGGRRAGRIDGVVDRRGLVVEVERFLTENGWRGFAYIRFSNDRLSVNVLGGWSDGKFVIERNGHREVQDFVQALLKRQRAGGDDEGS